MTDKVESIIVDNRIYRDVSIHDLNSLEQFIQREFKPRFPLNNSILLYMYDHIKDKDTEYTKEFLSKKLKDLSEKHFLCDDNNFPIFLDYNKPLPSDEDSLQDILRTRIFKIAEQVYGKEKEDISTVVNKDSYVYMMDLYASFIMNENVVLSELCQNIYKQLIENRRGGNNLFITTGQEKELLEKNDSNSEVNDIMTIISKDAVRASICKGYIPLHFLDLVRIIAFGLDCGFQDVHDNILMPVHVSATHITNNDDDDIDDNDIVIENTSDNPMGEGIKDNDAIVPIKVIGDEKSDEGRKITRRYRTLMKPMKLVKPSISADEIFDILNDEFPWMYEASMHIASSIAMCNVSDKPLYFKPILLNGSHGIGKTKWCHRVAELCKTAYDYISFSGISNAVTINGTERGYHQARPGFYIDTLEKTNIANPVILIDEVDKARATHNGDPFGALLPMLERDTAREHRDNYILGSIDLSWFCYVMTSNEKATLPAPLIDRVICIDCRTPTVEEAMATVKNIVKSLAKTYDIPEDKYPEINMDIARSVYKQTNSIRSLKSNIEQQFRQFYWKPSEKHKNLIVNVNKNDRKIGFMV